MNKTEFTTRILDNRSTTFNYSPLNVSFLLQCCPAYHTKLFATEKLRNLQLNEYRHKITYFVQKHFNLNIYFSVILVKTNVNSALCRHIKMEVKLIIIAIINYFILFTKCTGNAGQYCHAMVSITRPIPPDRDQKQNHTLLKICRI